jgi:thiol:disulfide interchange protein
MRTFHNRLLLFLAVLLALRPFGHAQVRESGNGAPGPVKAQHLTAELISDSTAAAVTAAAALAVPLSTAQPDRLQWQPFSNAALEQARSEGKPVFIDFTAAWCLSCQVNEKAVLEDRGVEQELLSRHYVLLRADWPR